MYVIVYGGDGWIGKQFIKILKERQIRFYKSSVRVYNTHEVKVEIDNLKPTHIISLIGRTHGYIDDLNIDTIDYLEYPGKLQENIRDNLYSPFLLAKMCFDNGIHFTYLGTGCIFNTEDNNNSFTEESEPNFFGSSYSIVKGFTDLIIKQYPVLNLRIRMPITDTKNKRNFITKITNYQKICSVPNSMSVLPELLPLIPELMERKTLGTLNFTNPGSISHNEILEMYKDIVDSNFTWTNFTIEEQHQILKSKRSNNVLKTDKLENLFPNIKNVKQAVSDVLHNYVNL